MNSKYLYELINVGDAKMIIKAQTGIFSTAFDVKNFESNYKCSLKLSDIQTNDTIRFIGYIIADKDIVIKTNDELIDIYGEGYRVDIGRRTILAVSNTESLSYSTSNNDFIRFSVLDELIGKGYTISFGTNYINVTIGPELNGAYGIIKNSKRGICSIFDSHLVFEVFVYTLVTLVQQYDEYCESDWFMLFGQVFIQTAEYNSFDEFKMTVQDGNVLDMSEIYKMAHLMTNNQIENSLIALSKMEEQ